MSKLPIVVNTEVSHPYIATEGKQAVWVTSVIRATQDGKTSPSGMVHRKVYMDVSGSTAAPAGTLGATTQEDKEIRTILNQFASVNLGTNPTILQIMIAGEQLATKQLYGDHPGSRLSIHTISDTMDSLVEGMRLETSAQVSEITGKLGNLQPLGATYHLPALKSALTSKTQGQVTRFTWVTDGRMSDDVNPYYDLVKECVQNGTFNEGLIIGLGMQASEKFLKGLADLTDGKVTYFFAHNPEAYVRAVMHQVDQITGLGNANNIRLTIQPRDGVRIVDAFNGMNKAPITLVDGMFTYTVDSLGGNGINIPLRLEVDSDYLNPGNDETEVPIATVEISCDGMQPKIETLYIRFSDDPMIRNAHKVEYVQQTYLQAKGTHLAMKAVEEGDENALQKAIDTLLLTGTTGEALANQARGLNVHVNDNETNRTLLTSIRTGMTGNGVVPSFLNALRKGQK